MHRLCSTFIRVKDSTLSMQYLNHGQYSTNNEVFKEDFSSCKSCYSSLHFFLLFFLSSSSHIPLCSISSPVVIIMCPLMTSCKVLLSCPVLCSVFFFFTLCSHDVGLRLLFFWAEKRCSHAREKSEIQSLRLPILSFFFPFSPFFTNPKNFQIALFCFLHLSLTTFVSHCSLSSSPIVKSSLLLAKKRREGTHWSERRKSLNRVFLKQKTISEYSTVFNEVITDLLTRWTLAIEQNNNGVTSSSSNQKQNLSNNMFQGQHLQNLERELYNWSIECKSFIRIPTFPFPPFVTMIELLLFHPLSLTRVSENIFFYSIMNLQVGRYVYIFIHFIAFEIRRIR